MATTLRTSDQFAVKLGVATDSDRPLGKQPIAALTTGADVTKSYAG